MIMFSTLRYSLIHENDTSYLLNYDGKEDKHPMTLMQLYQEELEKRKTDVVHTKMMNEDKILEPIESLQHMIQIKHKINQMKETYQRMMMEQSELQQRINKENETSTLLDSYIKLQKDIHDLLTNLAMYRTIIKDTDSKEIEWICSICQTEKITHCISPCGHTYCSQCTEQLCRVKYIKCYICRQDVKHSTKIYFS
jgi:Zinc finger, C3HC4 type (RING finger)